MTPETSTLFTAGILAKDLGVTDAKVKKAIKELNLEPAAKKGCCCYYTSEDREKIKAALK